MSATSSKNFIILLLIIPLILTVIWFKNGLITGGGEEGIPFYNVSKTLQLSTSVWIEYGPGIPTASWLPKATLIYLATIVDRVGIPPFIFQQIMFYVLMIIGMFSIYFLTLNLLEQHKSKELISVVTAFFYLFNPFSMSQVWGRGLYAQYFSFALLPAALLFFYLGIKRKNYLFGILLVLITSILSAAYGFLTFVVVYWFVIFLYFAYAIVTSEDKKSVFFFGIKFTIFIFMLWCVINAWWLIPLFFSSGSLFTAGISGSEENLGTLIGVSRNFTPDILIRLLQKTYFFAPSPYNGPYSNWIFQLMSFIAPAFLLVGLFKIIRNRELIRFKFFAVILILGLIVCLGANSPFGWLFIKIFKHVGVLQAFRNPFEKFGLVLVLGYSPIFAYGLVSVLESIRLRRIILVIVLLLTCGVFAWPMWTGRVIAGPDKKIGISIPSYYKDLQKWLNINENDYRLLMTPLWSGDGSFYEWPGGGRYQGSDPMIYILDQPTISNNIQAPFYYDFMTSLRKYMERTNTAPSLSLLRSKYLVNRTDAIMISEAEKKHIDYLTEVIFPPLEETLATKKLCSNLYANSKANNTAWITCQITESESDWSNIKYLHIKIKANVSALLDIAIRDKNGIRVRWDGRKDSEYLTTGSDWTTLTIPLGDPTEYSYEIDFSKVDLLEVQARQKDNPQTSTWEIYLDGVSLDTGKEEKTNAFQLINKFGKLELYEPTSFKTPDEYGSVSKITIVKNFVQLFEEADKQKALLDHNGFVIPAQNSGKNMQVFSDEQYLQILDRHKLSNTKYWLKVDNNPGFILLSKAFLPQWKLIPSVSKEKLSGNLFDKLDLLRKESLNENSHYVVNGYANLWIVDGETSSYAIVYKPQIIADIGMDISKLSLVPILGMVIILFIKKNVKNRN